MPEDIYSDIFTTQRNFFVKRIEKNIEKYLGDMVINLKRIGQDVLCEISSGDITSFLGELKENEDLGVEVLSNIDTVNIRNEVFLIICLSIPEQNFSLFIKSRMDSVDYEISYKKALDSIKQVYEKAEFYTDRSELKSACSDVAVFARGMDGLDSYDVFISTEEDRIEEVFIDTDISRLDRPLIGQRASISDSLAYSGRYDYRAGIFPELCICMGFEHALRIKINKKAQYIRMLLCELFRISNHIYYIINLAKCLDLNMVYNIALIEREKVLRAIESITGSRIIPNFIRIGGVKEDVDSEKIIFIDKLIPSLFARIKRIEDLFLDNNDVVNRIRDIGQISRSEALKFDVTGPNLRASGMRYDLRKSEDHILYKNFSFSTPLGSRGDCLDRAGLRFKEMYQSLKILKDITGGIPDRMIRRTIRTEHISIPYTVITGKVECPHGVFRVYLEAEDNGILDISFSGPSINTIKAAEHILKGQKVEDIDLILLSLDISSGEIMGHTVK